MKGDFIVRAICTAALFPAAITTMSAAADTNTWIGDPAEFGDWHDAPSWSLGTVPDNTDDAVIDNGAELGANADSEAASLDVGVDGGSGTFIFSGSLFQSTDLDVTDAIRVGVTANGATASRGVLHFGSSTELSADSIAVGVSRAAGDADGYFTFGSDCSPFGGICSPSPVATSINVGRVEAGGGATGTLEVTAREHKLSGTELNIGYNSGVGNATGILTGGDTDTGLMGFDDIRIGWSDPASSGDTEARVDLDQFSLSGTNVYFANHQGSGALSVDVDLRATRVTATTLTLGSQADVTIDLPSTTLGTSAGNYGNFFVGTATIDGALTARFLFVPLAGSHTFTLIDTLSGIPPSGIILSHNLNQGFTQDAFGIVGNDLVLEISGAPVFPEWNAGTGDWFGAANWSSTLAPGGGDPVTVNNGGTAQAGAGTAAALSLDVGINGGAGTVAVSPGAVLNITNHFHVGATDSGAVVSTGALTFDGASGAVGDAFNDELRVGYVGTGGTASGSLSLTDSALSLGTGLVVGKTTFNSLPGSSAIGSLTLDNSALSIDEPFARIDLGTAGGAGPGSFSSDVSLTLLNGSTLDVDDINLVDITAHDDETITVDAALTVRDSTVNSKSAVDLGGHAFANDNNAVARAVSTIDIAGSTWNTDSNLAIAAEVRTGTSCTNSLAETTATVAVTDSDLALTNLLIATSVLGQGASCVARATGTADWTGGSLTRSPASVFGRWIFAEASSNNGGLGEADLAASFDGTTASGFTHMELGRASVNDGGTGDVRLTVDLRDADFSFSDDLELARLEKTAGGVEADVDAALSLDGSTIGFGGHAYLGLVKESENFVPGTDLARATLSLTDSLFDVAGDLNAGHDGTVATILLNPSLATVGGTLNLGAGAATEFHIEGPARASAANTGNGTSGRYGAIDADMANLAGTAKAVFDVTSLVPGTELDLIVLGTGQSFSGAFGPFVVEAPPGFDVDASLQIVPGSSGNEILQLVFNGASVPGGIDISDLLQATDASSVYKPSDPRAPAGVVTLSATFTNMSSDKYSNVVFLVDKLTGGNVLLNENAPVAKLKPRKSFTAVFEIGLQQATPFRFFVDAVGTPT